MSPECTAVAGSADYLKCERIIRGFDPDNGPSLTELWLDDHDRCIGSQFVATYRTLPYPGDTDESWGYWFHYLLNEKSIRTGGHRVSIDSAIAIALIGESGVPSLYPYIKDRIAEAMIYKGRARGMYVALASRQTVRDHLRPVLLFEGKLANSNRNE